MDSGGFAWLLWVTAALAAVNAAINAYMRRFLLTAAFLLLALGWVVPGKTAGIVLMCIGLVCFVVDAYLRARPEPPSRS